MKDFLIYLGISAILILATNLAPQAFGIQDNKQPADVDFEKLNPMEAMAIANEWKWSQKDVKSYVTVREVVFEFSDGTKKVISLPEERMLVAVAPYIRRTHK